MPQGGELMAKELFVPKLGQTVEEVNLVKWLVQDGDKVEQGQEVLEVETDKAVFAVEATGNGYIHIGPYAAGTAVPVLTVVATIGKKDEAFGVPVAAAAAPTEQPVPEEPLPAPESQPKHAPGEDGGRVFASPRARRLAAERGVDLANVTPTGGAGARVAERDVLSYLAASPKATPLAEKLAVQAGLDLRSVTGSGPGGRITREDVEARLRPAGAVALASEAPVAPATLPAHPPATLPAAEVADRIPLKGIRGIIAERMGASVHTTARVTLVSEVDATELVALRERLKARLAESWGFTPGYNDLLALVVSRSLRQHPYMNARLAPDAIELLSRVNLGMAVDTERGLMVPVIRDADTKGLRSLGLDFRELVDRARKGRSLPDDLSGGTFTITNLGMHDIDAFTPVINLPEAAILGVGRITPKWVYRPESPDAPVLRQMLTLSLVFDHRLVDGAPAARFLQAIKGAIEEPYLLLAGN
jgi:pyruvate dehydrogenase E2 component (dihydrolipoamide acetyltransferase)